MSKVIIYMAITANGYIAKEDDNTSWISEEEWKSYSAIVRKSGCMIIGHRTYDILTKQPEFIEFEKIKIVVLSNENFVTLSPNHLIAKSCREALDSLTDFEEVVVAGGGNLNSQFMEQNLVDEIYLDIEPIVFGKGIKLFADSGFESRLKLLGMNKLSDHEIQVHYKVIK